MVLHGVRHPARILKKRLYPAAARRAANEHNALYHGGRPTAHIVVDTENTDGLPLGRPPYYVVICEECNV